MAIQSTTAIATVTLQSAANQVIFNSIPNTYRDLIVVISGSSNGGTSPSLRFNGDSATNYSIVRMAAQTSNAISQGFSAEYISVAFMENVQTTVVAQIFDYNQTNKHKTVLGRGGTSTIVRAELGRWANNAAIHTVNVGMDGGALYNSGTIISLYGRIA